jgi:hypothetical protein
LASTCGTLNISTANFTTGIKEGGLGFPDVEEFICSLQIGSIKKCIGNTIDVWRYDVNKSTGNNPLLISQFDEWPINSDLALGIVTSLDSLKVCFYHINNNFLNSELYGNPLLRVNNGNLRFDINLIPPPRNLDWQHRKNCRLHELLDGTGNFDPKISVERTLNCNLTDEVFNNLKAAVISSIKRVNKKKIDLPERQISDLTTFMRSFKKGSKPIRKIFETFRNKNTKIRNRTNIKTFFRLIDLGVPDPEIIMQINLQWSLKRPS